MLVTSDGTAKVTDFGLARALTVSESHDAPPTRFLVSHAGMTDAYRSPEQSRHEPLGRATDIWSWGVSLLHMALGEIIWLDGTFAPEVLNRILENQFPAGPLMALHASRDVLCKCFLENPDDRWATLAEAARELIRIYETQTGKAYDRAEPPIVSDGKIQSYSRWLTSGIRWADPAQRVKEAFFRAGSRVWPHIDFLSARHPKGKAVSDLVGFRDALQMIERAMSHRPAMVEVSVIEIYLDIAFAEEWLGDLPGAFAAYDKAIEYCQSVAGKFPDPDQVQSFLSTLYMNKAKALNSVNDLTGADALLTKAIQISEVVAARHPEELNELDHLAAAYNGKGEVLRRLGHPEDSMEWYDRAINIRIKLLGSDPGSVAPGLTQVYLNKAELLKSIGPVALALKNYDAALELIGSAASYQRSAVLFGKADALRTIGQTKSAVQCCEEAIAIRQRLVATDTNWALAAALAQGYLLLATLMQTVPGTQALAPQWCRKAVAIYEKLIREHGKSDLKFELFAAYTRLATSLQLADESPADREAYDQAFAFGGSFSTSEKRVSEYLGTLATAYFNRALLAERDDDFENGLDFYDRSLKTFDTMTSAGKQPDSGAFARTRLYRAHLLHKRQPSVELKNEMRESLKILEAEANRTAEIEWISVLQLVKREHWLGGE